MIDEAAISKQSWRRSSTFLSLGEAASLSNVSFRESGYAQSTRNFIQMDQVELYKYFKERERYENKRSNERFDRRNA